MKRRLFLSLAGVSTTALASPAILTRSASSQRSNVVPRDRIERLARGVNLSTVFGTTAKSIPALRQDVRLIKDAGFGHIRIFVGLEYVLQQLTRTPQSAFTNEPVGAAAQAGPYARLMDIVNEAVTRDLAVILCMESHKEKIRVGSSAAQQAKWVAAWQHLSNHFGKVRPQLLYFEIANEPETSPEQWGPLQERLRLTIRRNAPGHTLILTGSPTSTVWSLSKLEPSSDSNVVYSFHQYQPMVFTHQGAAWLDEAFVPFRGLVYPPDRNNIEQIDRRGSPKGLRQFAERGINMMGDEIIAAALWAKAHDVKLVATEFGVYTDADANSRAAWLRQARAGFEENGIGWTVWEWEGGFGIKPAILQRTCPAIKSALRVC